MNSNENWEYCEEYYPQKMTGLQIEKIPIPWKKIVKNKLPRWVNDIKVTNTSKENKIIKLFYNFKGKKDKGDVLLKPNESHLYDGYYQYGIDIYNENSAYKIDSFNFSNSDYFRCNTPLTIKKQCKFKFLHYEKDCSYTVYRHK